MNNLQKTGGVAALLHAAAYVAGIVLGVTMMFPALNAGPGQYLAFVGDNQALVYGWNLVSYWGSAVTLVVMALALYERLKNGSPALAQVATVFGLIWAALIIGSGNLMLRDVGVISELYGKNPAQAETTWLALGAVENGIVSGNEMVGSVWVMLLSLAALRTKGLPRGLTYFGVALGALGIVTGILAFIPAVKDAILIFGPAMIVWSAWVGIIMLRNRPGAAA